MKRLAEHTAGHLISIACAWAGLAAHQKMVTQTPSCNLRQLLPNNDFSIFTRFGNGHDSQWQIEGSSFFSTGKIYFSRWQ
ncbi:hypothetical protein DP590_07145 [Salmonella enterica]|nr:hypothetical protein [Salmonella enterica]